MCIKFTARIVTLSLFLPVLGFAKEYGHLESYEPIYIGYTQDEDDVPFMDFKLSMKYPILHSGKPQSAAFDFLPLPYFSFSGRFAQYIGTRLSSPVIGRRYNPELIGRYWLGLNDTTKSDSLDLIYGHESNGQSINDPTVYQVKQIVLEAEGEDIKFADDYISRGWDYVGMLWTHNWTSSTPHNDIMTFFKLHYFLENGVLQGNQEEYNDWENDSEGKPRKYIDGLSFSVKKNIDLEQPFIRSEKIFLQYVTGIEKSFEFHTVRAEFSLTLGNLPIMIWASHGYNSDLADYYRELTSYGVAIEVIGY